jgi:hypothetical protein
LPILWSDHAIQRVAERFGFTDREIPNEKINEKANPLQNRMAFKVRDGGVVYVCVKFRKYIMVKTVYPKDPKRKTAYRRKILKDKKRVRAGSISAIPPSGNSDGFNSTGNDNE